ncbi:penicillin-binding protein 2 [Haloferula luteola]|uniref:Penicillin-binding protein 2 n=1 Tax=Haloferula luteola TaxID=595692 RepID=A0A840VBG4_9BACT|nr:penicillin-binding transpeptidase domain-containing protein [Haloferula luteola]MBB5352018.1 penicillin-binding protein 2 [Haloferula luteola]
MWTPLKIARVAALGLITGIPAWAQNTEAVDVGAMSADDASIFSRKDARTIQLEIPAPRGPILDREGFPLAQNRVVYRLAVQYEQFSNEDRDAIVAWGRQRVAAAKVLLAEVAEPSDEELYQHYRHRRWLPLPISSTLTPEEAEAIQKKLPRGIELQAIYERYYPEKELAAHVIGYTGLEGKLPTGPINLNEPLWERSEGRAGFEKLFDKELRGSSATLRMVFNEKGEMLLREQKGRPRTGGALVSTLNLRWQRQAEEVLDDHARRGAMVVIDVVTGEVLVMASNPSYDLNKWIPGISHEDYDELKNSASTPLFARAFQGNYPPASSFKSVVALAALNEKAIRPETTVYCPAYLEFGNHKLWNWSKKAAGDLTVVSALKWSNNPWFAQVGNRVGSSSLFAMARRLGYGKESGLPLIGESAGFLPTPEWVQKTAKRRITEGDVANWSIGQGAVLATPLQVAQAMAGIANGGVLPKLHLVMQIQDSYGRVIESAQAERRNWLSLDPEAVATVKEGMREVVDGGTGSRASLDWIEVCGKTGTGQWGLDSKHQRVAWFAGFLPAEEPRLAFACLYEGRPGETVGGGRNAGPMVPAFFDAFREEIEEMCAPAPKAVLVVDEVAEQEKNEGILRALPVSPLDEQQLEADGEGAVEEIPSAIPVDEGDLPMDPSAMEEAVPQALPVDEGELGD